MSAEGKTGFFALAAAAALLVCAVGVSAGDQNLVFGVAPGPYGDLIRHAIKPSLEKQGYTVAIREFSDYVQPNLALDNGDLDANLFQHARYLRKFSADKGLKLSDVITVPTAGLGLYSRKLQVTDAEALKKALKPGDTVTLANDPTNLARALALLQKHGLLTLKGTVDPTKASEKDIDQNPYGLAIRPIEAAQLPRSLDSVTLSVVNGNYALAAGIPLDSAIIKEVLTEDLKNLVAVRTADLDRPFVKDLKAVIQSESFKNAVEDPTHVFKDFQRPAWYVEQWNIRDR